MCFTEVIDSDVYSVYLFKWLTKRKCSTKYCWQLPVTSACIMKRLHACERTIFVWQDRNNENSWSNMTEHSATHKRHANQFTYQ